MDKEKSPLKQIRTFQGDVAEALEKQHESLVSIQRVEHLKKDSIQSSGKTAEVSKKRIEFTYLLLGSLLLFVLSATGVWYAYNEFVRKTSTPPIATPANRFIYSEAELVLNISETSREDFIKTLSSALEEVADGEVRHVVLEKSTLEGTELLPTSEFLNILKSRAPGNLIRAFDPLFMLGAYGKSTFLILRLDSFENAFAGMLAWEKDLNRDIGPLLATAEIARNIEPGTIFTDIIDRNKDARILSLYDEVTLIYSFLDNNTLIITDNLETLRVVVDRLTKEKLSR
ncbi:MAG: hypothetical protein COV96_00235 [Candidatus Zambryskibacteria bacterium CG11_big_fil_rev_8_21_14_0_20_42_18]|uniref:DUF3352 domain-containing protein n=1 Tax=Candidatus Zambryskibacteria bacterium CG_4_9_14_3_um_filter_42_15 TaxID=1975112 RepID=A0A2M7WRJ7_9BACT|nr:MAG: hypothetical protein COV96_00235 [Candidatus Zambryskibacteria bacterium CG11_big_fil_rev_8_21_14_0_20_42_18]PJA32629.1 MAG: hypothetical protein CO185_02285 [Candidatus Zambryskibacteria bacterium CG_4_9_14_3_um_filter_42_15]